MSKQQEQDSKGSFPLVGFQRAKPFGGFGRSPKEAASVSVHERARSAGDMCVEARAGAGF